MAALPVIRLDALVEGEGRVVTIGDREFAVFLVDGTPRVLDNHCAHRGGPLGEGLVDGGAVTCPWHGWEFDLATGVARHRDDIRVGCHAARIEGDHVVIDDGDHTVIDDGAGA